MCINFTLLSVTQSGSTHYTSISFFYKDLFYIYYRLFHCKRKRKRFFGISDIFEMMGKETE